MDKLYYDRENKKFYVKELNTEKNGDILIVTDEQYVDVTDEIVELFQEHIAKDGRQVLCYDTTIPQLPDTVYVKGKKLEYSGYPSPGSPTEPIEEEKWKPTPEQLCESIPLTHEQAVEQTRRLKEKLEND